MFFLLLPSFIKIIYIDTYHTRVGIYSNQHKRNNSKKEASIVIYYVLEPAFVFYYSK